MLETCVDVEPMPRGIWTALLSRWQAIESRFRSLLQCVLSISDQALVSGTSFLTAIIVGRMTTAEELGLYYLVLSIAMMAAAVEESGVFLPYVVYSKRRTGDELDEYTGSVWTQMLLLCVLSVVLLLTMILILTATGHSAVVPGLWALCVAGPLILIRNGIRRLAFARLHVWTAIALDAIVAAGQLGALLAWSYFGQLTVASIFLVMGGACAVASVCTYLFDPLRMRFKSERMMEDWRQNWSFAKWALRSYLLGFTAPYVLLWILGLTSGPAAAGLLGMCSSIIGMTNVPVMGLDNVLTPQATHAFSTLGSRGLWPILLRTGAILTLFLGGLALFVLLTGDWLAMFFFGAAGIGTNWILAVLAISATLNGISTVAGNGLWAIDRPRAGFIADLSNMATTLLAAIVFVPKYGALGAAMSTLAGMTIAASVRVWMLVRCLRDADRPHEKEPVSEIVGDQDCRLVMESAEAAM